MHLISLHLISSRLNSSNLISSHLKSMMLNPFKYSACLVATILLGSYAHATDLQDTYELAQQYDSTIKAAEYDYESAIQRLPLARSAFRPQLNFAYDAARNEERRDDFGTYDSQQFSLSLRQSLFNRENGAIVDQARLGVEQAEAQLLAQQQNLILRTSNAYFDVLRAQVEVEFSGSELDAIARQKEQAERRFEVGLVPVTDVRSAQAQYDLAVAAQIAAKNQLHTALGQMEVLTGSIPENIAPLASDLPLIAPDPANVDAWVNLALQQNLDLAAARLASQTAAAGVSAIRGSRYPTLDLVGAAQAIENEKPGRDLKAGLLGLEVRMPVYTGGRIRSQVRQAKADSNAAQQNLLSQERSTAQQTRDAFRGVTGSIARANALQQALISTRKSAEATDAGFRAGTRTSVEVLQALRDVFRAESDFAGARYDYIINYLSLKAAAGTLTADDLIPINNFLVQPGAQ